MLTQYLSDALLNHVLGVTTYASPGTVYAALFTVAPTDTSAGVEVSAGDYQRVSTSWNAASAGQTNNSLAIRFPASGTTVNNWGTIVAIGLFDSPVQGNLLIYGPTSAQVVMTANNTFSVATGSLVIDLDVA